MFTIQEFTKSQRPIRGITPPPTISSNLFEEETMISSYDVIYYNRSGFGVEMRWSIKAKSEDEAKNIARGKYSIPQSHLYCLYAFKVS